MEQVRAFVEGSEPVDYKPKDRASAYASVRRALAAFDYDRLGRADRGCVRAYIDKVCGFSPGQIMWLVRPAGAAGVMEDRRSRNSGRAFERVYTLPDIRLLVEVDEVAEAFGGMSALVEGKNAHVVRKHLGHERTPARFARECPSPFLKLPPPLPVRHRSPSSPPSFPSFPRKRESRGFRD